MMTKPGDNPFQDMCLMIGMMAITWAWAENALALAIGIIDEKIGAVRGHGELPLSLRKRLSYLKNALADIPALKILEDDGGFLVKRFVELAPRRNELIHGSTWTIPHDLFETLHLPVVAGKYAGKQQSIQIGDVLRFNTEVVSLANAASAFLRRISEALS
jgi:hypothetical protein